MIISIVVFLVVILVLVLAHEFGHFITARAFKVKIIEFAVGFPPRLWSIKRGDIIYSLNAVPLGGFVKLAGEEDPGVAGALASKKWWERIIVLASGSLMNLILPIVLFSIAFMLPHSAVMGQVTVEDVAPNSPASMAGIAPGDVLLSINGKPVENIGDLRRLAQLNLGSEITVKLKRGDAVKEVRVVPRWKPPPGQGAVGVVSRLVNPTVVSQSEPIWRAVPMGVTQCGETLIIFKNEIGRWIIGASPVQVTGPVGIAQVTGEVARTGISPLFEFAAFISINLGIVNIFPLPALDGGRIAFVVIEVLRGGRRVSPKTEGLVHMIGFALLMALVILVTYRDIINIVTSGSAVP
ncbi:MAG: RIP metalloprotease RseP [Dehalococcoidia bacterium]|nr:RIP metalloprotease RseP [Dehalococcoidia bacterium]